MFELINKIFSIIKNFAPVVVNPQKSFFLVAQPKRGGGWGWVKAGH